MFRSLSGPILFALGLGFAGDAAADVYKCTINGEVKYQDSPCPGNREQAPHLKYEASAPPPPTEEAPTSRNADAEGDDTADADADADGVEEAAPATNEDGGRSPSPAPAAEPEDDRPLDRVALLHPEIERAQAEQRDLQRQYRDAKLKLSVVLAAETDKDAVRRQNRRLDQEWKGRIADAGKRVRALQAELAALCPNGTFMNGTRQECR